MTTLRRYDSSNTEVHHRSDRLFCDNGLWYFRTREGSNIGPFRYRSEAQAGLSVFVNQLTEADRQVLEQENRKPRFRLPAVITETRLPSPFRRPYSSRA